jgi:uncharacterized membrane protein YccC
MDYLDGGAGAALGLALVWCGWILWRAIRDERNV